MDLKKTVYEKEKMSFEDKFEGLVKPKKVFGSYAEEDFEENRVKIYTILLIILTIAIVSTIAYTDSKNKDFSSENKEMIVVVVSISWFIFSSFVFLLFDATRLFHVLLFITIIVVGSIVIEDTKNKNNSEVSSLLITSVVLSGVVFLFLGSYFVLSRADYDIHYLREKQKITTAVEKAVRKSKEEMSDYESVRHREETDRLKTLLEKLYYSDQLDVSDENKLKELFPT